jgi:hypothetical protein
MTPAARSSAQARSLRRVCFSAPFLIFVSYRFKPFRATRPSSRTQPDSEGADIDSRCNSKPAQ